MSDMFKPLTEEELQYLDDFLLYRIEDEEEAVDRDEGVLDASELDGLLTAIVSGPVPVHMSRWLPVIWGEYEPEWQSDEEFEQIISLIMRHMNGIAATLMDQPDAFEPLFQLRDVEDKTFVIVDEWCEGYMLGVELAREYWDLGGEYIASLLEPVYAFTTATNWSAHELNERERDRVREAIAPAVRDIHAYWLSRRDEFSESVRSPVRRAEPRVGRNDPCPCGSGRKYKKCCLH